jgi:hypothetical protein
MEFVLKISTTWLTQEHYIYANYRRTWLRVYHRGVYQLFVLMLLLFHAGLNSGTVSVQAKMGLFLLVTCLMALYTTVLPVYRCVSSSAIYMLCWWTLAANCFMGFLRSIDYDSQSMVDENFYQIIGLVNLTCAILIGFVVLVSIALCLQWPVNLRKIKDLNIAYRHLLIDLRNA